MTKVKTSNCKAMTYDITSSVAPPMPKLGKGLECIKLIASQISPDMREPIIPMLFPPLAAHVSGSEFQYPDLTWKEPVGMFGHLISESGMGKGQLTEAVEAINRSFRSHDEVEIQKIVEWARATKKKGANKDKPDQPDSALYFPPADASNPAFLLNAMACEKQGGHTQYFNMPEIEMADGLCGGHKKVSQTIRNIYDMQRAGALRATADGVTGNPLLRVNINFSSTPYAARRWYKNDLFIGTFGRIPFSYKKREERSGKIPRRGKYDETFLEKLDVYLARLEECKGRFVIPKLNKLAEKLAADMAKLADIYDSDVFWDNSKRSIVGSWKAGCALFVMNNQVWTRAMGELVEWMVYHDLWSKMQVFGDMLKGGDVQVTDSKCGPTNMLNSLQDSFTKQDLEDLRLSLEKSREGTQHQLQVWKNRGFITYSAQTSLYTKTEAYLKK